MIFFLILQLFISFIAGGSLYVWGSGESGCLGRGDVTTLVLHNFGICFIYFSKQVEEIGNEIRTLKESGGSKNTIKNLVKKLKKAKTEVETLQSVPTKIGGLPQTDDHKIDYSRDFFGQPTFLTVSGQLQVYVDLQRFL